MLQSNNLKEVYSETLIMFFQLDNQFQREYSGYLTLFLNGCIRKRKKSLFFFN